MTILYNPPKDELLLKFGHVRRKPTKELDRFKLWWDKEGNIRAIAITGYTEELKEFREKRGWIRLGGIWKGIKIDEEDIKEARQELLKKIEKRWERF